MMRLKYLRKTNDRIVEESEAIPLSRPLLTAMLESIFVEEIETIAGIWSEP
jgi:hypothetical protein